MASNSTTLGWVAQPDGRGTFDIIQSCAFTIIICIWTSLCVNVGAPGETTRHQLIDKFNLACIGLLGPEFIIMLAIGQWRSALRSVEDMGELGKDSWSMTHAFFADMGGFALKPEGWQQFPIDAKQLWWLVKHGYVDYPSIERDEIKDRDKFDGLAR